jgi:hypothetical protein
MANPVLLAKFTNPGPVANAFIKEWNEYFKGSKYVGHGASKTGTTAYAKFSIPAVNKFKLCKVSIRVRYHSKPSGVSITSDVWEAWAKLRVEKITDGARSRNMFYDWTRNYTGESSLSKLFNETGANGHQDLYEAFFTAVGFMPELDKAAKDVASSSTVEEKKKIHEVKSALFDIRAPLRTLLRHGIETEQLHEMINHEIVDLITDG